MSSDSTTAHANLVSFYVGLSLSYMLYGIEICLYFKTMHILLTGRRQHRISNVLYAALSTLVFALATVFVAIEGSLAQAEWQPNGNYPGSPIAYGQRPAAYAPTDAVAAVAVVLQQMANALMMYRCRILWDSLRVMIVPSIVWFVMFVLGIIAICSAGMTTTNVFSEHIYEFGLAYYCMAVSLNVILTIMICYRLARNMRPMAIRFENKYSLSHLNIGKFFVESMLLLTLVGIAFVIAYGIKSPSRAALSLVYALMTGLSPQMLILRVVEEHALQNDASTRPAASTIIFPSYPGSLSHSSGDVDGEPAIRVATSKASVAELSKSKSDED